MEIYDEIFLGLCSSINCANKLLTQSSKKKKVLLRATISTAEATTKGVLHKKVFVKIWQYSYGNAFVGVSF